MNYSDRRSLGFTLAELLVVVAIIAVLTAVAIPVFTSQMEKSREAADTANIRDQYAEVMVTAMERGADVNDDGADFGKISLRQKDDGWQSTDMGHSLSGIATVEGGPTEGGSAWVTYTESNGAVIHFSGTSVTPGGSTGGSTGDGASPVSGFTLKTGFSSFSDIKLKSSSTKDYKFYVAEAPCTATFKIVSKGGHGQSNGNKLQSEELSFSENGSFEFNIQEMTHGNGEFFLEVTSVSSDDPRPISVIQAEIENALLHGLYESD